MSTWLKLTLGCPLSLIQLSCCPLLKLFATSSEDQSVKIWNFENQLVRELCFDSTLCGVSFANARGDLLVGFQLHISLVTLTKYLPVRYLERVSQLNFDNDPFEGHVQFDRHLKFWYDPQTVPTVPLDLTKRRIMEASRTTELRRPKKVLFCSRRRPWRHNQNGLHDVKQQFLLWRW